MSTSFDATQHPRHPAGVSGAGQFANKPRAEAEVSLAATDTTAGCRICTDVVEPGHTLCTHCEESEARHAGKLAREVSPEEAANIPAPERLSAMTPVEVDTEMAKAMDDGERALRKQEWALQDAERVSDLPRRGYGAAPHKREDIVAALRAKIDNPQAQDHEARTARRALDALESADAAVDARRKELAAYDAEWHRRGRWSRAFLVVGGDGHVHSSMSCSTCNRGNSRTNFQFMTEFSGKDEGDIVKSAGWRACTVCYPSAPVGTKSSLPTSMWSKDEEAKAAARAEREAKKATRDAAKIAKAPTPDGKELRVEWTARNAPGWERNPSTGENEYVHRDRNEHVVLATERAAVQWYLDEHLYFPTERDDKAPAFEAIERSLAAKHGKTVEQMRAELQAKVELKRRREAR